MLDAPLCSILCVPVFMILASCKHDLQRSYLPHVCFLLLFVLEYILNEMGYEDSASWLLIIDFRIWMTNLFDLITLKVPLACALDCANAYWFFDYVSQNSPWLSSSSGPFIFKNSKIIFTGFKMFWKFF
jgi:hypothetical protein